MLIVHRPSSFELNSLNILKCLRINEATPGLTERHDAEHPRMENDMLAQASRDKEALRHSLAAGGEAGISSGVQPTNSPRCLPARPSSRCSPSTRWRGIRHGRAGASQVSKVWMRYSVRRFAARSIEKSMK